MEVGGGFICEVPDCVTEGGSSPGPLGAGLFSMPGFGPDTQKSGPRPHQRGKTSQPLHGANYFFADLSKFFLTFAPAPRHLRGSGAAPERRTLRFRSGMWNMLHECSEKLLRVLRSLKGGMMLFSYPRGPRIARGGECAGAPPVAEKATKHSRQRRCRRKRKRRGDGLPRRWARCAGA